MRRFVIAAACVACVALPGFGQKVKSQKEAQAVQAMLQAQTPEDRIKAANDVITNFADTEFKPYALFIEADAYFQKGDVDKAPFRSVIDDYYLTNPIARASAVMAECSALAEGRGAMTAAE